MAEAIDFKSGQKDHDLLIMFLGRFVRLSTKPALLDDTNSDIEFATKVVKLSMEPIDSEMLHTGSLAEGVAATYTKPTVIGISAVYSPESDLMTVVKIQDVLHDSDYTYKLEVVEAQPCFVVIRLSGDRTNTPDLEYAYRNSYRNFPPVDIMSTSPYKLLGSSLLETGHGDVISPLFYLEYCKELFKTTVEQAWYTFKPMNYSLQMNQYEVSIHGPAVKLTSTSLFSGLLVYPKAESLKNPYSEEEERSMGQTDLDIVPAIHFPEWPSHGQEWITRKRLWPSKQIINDIVKGGVMVVCKTSPNGDPELQWRLSFSRAEVTLLADRSLPCRQQAHKIFKYIVKHIISPPKILNSYHCKTITLWASERMDPDSWTWERLAHIVLGLLDDLQAAIAAKVLPHYFIPQFNLFVNIPSEFMQTVGQRMAEIRENPIQNIPKHGDYVRDAILSGNSELIDMDRTIDTDDCRTIVSLLEKLRGTSHIVPEILPVPHDLLDSEEGAETSDEDSERALSGKLGEDWREKTTHQEL